MKISIAIQAAALKEAVLEPPKCKIWKIVCHTSTAIPN